MDSLQNFPDLEEYVERYELAWETDDDVELTDHLPPPDHPYYHQTIVELIRADLELSRRRGRPTRLADYVHRFSDVFEDRAALAQVAFEEYRLRFQDGEPVTREEYGAQFAINTSDWPAWLKQRATITGGPVDEAAATSAGLPTVGSRFADFELMAELGRGASGRVYLARQGDLANRFVALKITTRPNSEPQRLAQLQHTNIVPIYSVHRQGDFQAVCMPFLGASTLASALASFRQQRTRPQSGQQFLSTLAVHRQSTLPTSLTLTPDLESGSHTASKRPTQLDALAGMSYADVAVWLAAKVADGLAHAHDHGVIHRDLKPANILISDDGEPLILDFHLATLMAEPQIAATNVGGTLPYMAPEHLRAVRSGGLVDERGDIYSLGAVLYEMLTGELPTPVPPGEFDAVVDRMAQDRSVRLPGARRLNRSVNKDVESIVAHCLAPQPSDRYSTAHELRTDLRRHLDNLPLRHAPNRSLVERVRKWTRRWPRLASASTVAAVAGVVLLGTVGLILARNRQLDRLSAQEAWRAFATRADAAESDLAAEALDAGLARDSIEHARQTLESQQALDDSWRQTKWYRLLSPTAQAELQDRIGRLQFRLAGATGHLARRTNDPKLIEESLRLNRLARSAWQGRIPEAVAQQEIYLSQLPNKSANNEHKISIHMNSSRATEASPVADRPGSGPPGADLLDRELSAMLQANLGRCEEAAAEFEELVNQEPSNLPAWFSLGSVYFKLGRLHEAEGCYRTCVSLQPDSFWGRSYLGLVRLQLGRSAEALVEFNRALQIRPTAPDALFNRALAHERLGQLGEAERDLTAAIDAGTTVTRAFFAREAVRQRLGNNAGAALDRQEGLRRVPTDELSWTARGFARLHEDPAQALADFQDALRLNPRFKPALQNSAAVLSEQLGRTPEAIGMLDRLVTLGPTEPEPVATRGVLWARLQNVGAALADAQAALKLGQDADTQYRVACIHALLIQPDEVQNANRALQLLGRAAWQNPDFVMQLIESDPDLALLRPDPRFAELVQRIADLRQL